MSTKDKTYKSWKRFSDFKLLAEYAKISDLRDTVMAWRHIQQVRERCLRAEPRVGGKDFGGTGTGTGGGGIVSYLYSMGGIIVPVLLDQVLYTPRTYLQRPITSTVERAPVLGRRRWRWNVTISSRASGKRRGLIIALRQGAFEL